MVPEKITELLDQKFTEDAFSDCFLVEVKLHSNNKLDVFIDSDSGLTFKKCQQVSRYLEQYLDEEGWLGPKYILEVSSPGLDRPLELKRQYHKNIGRKLEVQLEEGKPKVGTLTAVHEESIDLEEKVRVKEGNRKKTMVVTTSIPFDEIKKAKVKPAF